MSVKIVTGKVRMSYVTLDQPRQIGDSGDAKYSVTLLIPKSDTATLNNIKNAIQKARDLYCEKNGSAALPQKPVHTLYDGDGVKASGDPFGPECKGCYVISVNSKTKPLVVDAFRNEIPATDVYSGCYGRAQLDFYAYNAKSKKGVTASVLAVQKLSDGDRLDGGSVGDANAFDDGFVDDSGLDDIL